MNISYPEFVTVIQDMVLKPDMASSVAFFWFSLVNELFALIPYVLLVSGQLLFVDGDISASVFSKLFFYVAVPAGLGGAVGSLLTYGIAYFGGKPAIKKWEKYLKFSWEDVEKITGKLQGAWYDEAIFVVIRSIPVLPPLPLNVAAGIIRMHPLVFFSYTALGFVIRMMIMFAFMATGIVVLDY